MKLNAIHFPYLQRDFEPEMRRICDLAFQSAEHLIAETPTRIDPKAEPDRWNTFVQQVHRGFAAAQEAVIAELLRMGRASSPQQQQKELAIRKIADGIAWQLIGNQLYIARRLYRGQEPPDLRHSNFNSVRAAAAHVQRDGFARFALISDLTTFVQVGDLLIKEPTSFTIAEVKEGDRNEQILNFMEFMLDAKCDQALALFYQKEGKKSVDQLRRMLRQAARMAHVAELASTDRSTDPDSNEHIRVNEKPLQIESYGPRLRELLHAAKSDGWAIDIVDDCLFIGAYTGHMIAAARFVFEGWLRGVGVAKWNPIINILESMAHPLALPLFNRGVTAEHTFDLLFGRAAVFLCVDFERFMLRARESGIEIRWSSRKEAAKMRGEFGSLRVKNRIPIANINGVQFALGDGVTTRITLHEITPLSAVEALRTTVSAG